MQRLKTASSLLSLFLFFALIPTGYASEILYVPSDSAATYVVVKKVRNGNLATLATVRSGSSGKSFSLKLFDCSNQTFQYLMDENITVGNAAKISQKQNAALEKLAQFGPQGRMDSLAHGSISWYGYQYACK